MKANFTRTVASGGLRLLGAALIIAAPLSRSFAQLTFIPDAQLRDYLNDLVPGCVDGSGYLDPAFPGLQQVTELYPLSNCEDLTGLDQLTGVEFMKAGNLCLGCNTPEVLVFPPNLKHLWLENFYTGLLDGVVMVPPLPATLLTLRINDKLLSDTIGFTSFPPALERLELVKFFTGTPHFASLPAMPSTLRYVAFWQVAIEEAPALPTDLDSLVSWVWYANGPMAELPAGLDYLEWTSQDCLPPLPDGLETLYTNSQECLPNMPSTLTTGTVYWVPVTSAPLCGPLDDCPPAALITNVDAAEDAAQPMQVYPNPATDNLILDLPQNTSAAAVDVLDVVGRVVFTTMFSGTRAQMDVSALPAGLYHVRAAGQVADFVKN